MPPEAWVLAGIVVTQMAGFAGVWVTAHRGAGDAAAAKAHAAAASGKIEPVSNGFAGRVTATLDRIEDSVHGNRLDILEVRGDVRRLGERLDRHLRDHRTGGAAAPPRPRRSDDRSGDE